MNVISHIKTLDRKILIFSLILLGFNFLLFFKLGNVGLLGLDEPSYAEITREMIELNDYIVPRFNYAYHFHKPPLLNWCQAIFMNIFGVNEIAARLPSVLGSILAMLFAGIIAYKIYDIETSLMAAIVMASSVLVIALSRFSVTDMLFSTATNCSIISFFIAAEWSSMENRESTYKWYLIAFLFLSLSMLSKGPAGVILVFGVILPYLLWRSKIQNMILNEYFYLSCIVFLILTLPWFIVVHFTTAGEFTQVFFIHHNFTRFTDIVSGHSQPVWYFVPVIILGFIPWIFFLPQALKYTLSKSNFLDDIDQHTFNLFCLWWFIAIFVFFSLSRSKLYTYMLPAITPLAILVAVWIKNIIDNSTEKNNSYRFIPLIISLVGAIVLFQLKLNKNFIQISDVKGLDIAGIAFPLLVVLVVGMFISFIATFKNTFLSFKLFMITFFFIIMMFITMVFPIVDSYTEKTARIIAKSVPKDCRVAFLDARRYSINFYSKKYIYNFESMKDAKKFVKNNTFVLLVTRKKYIDDFKEMKLYREDNKYAYLIKSPY